MSDLKTKANDLSVAAFLNSIENPTRKTDGKKLLQLFIEETGEPPVMWGSSIIGFGKYTYTYKSGKEMEWFPVGYSPRKQALSLYLMSSHEELGPLLAKLGKYSRGKGCLYIKTLADIDEQILREIIHTSTKQN